MPILETCPGFLSIGKQLKSFARLPFSLICPTAMVLVWQVAELAYDLEVLGSIPATSPFFLDNVPF